MSSGAIDFPFKIDDRGRVAFVTNEVVRVRNEIVNCIMTMKRERVMRPIYGGGAPGFVFQPMNENLSDTIRTQLRNALEAFVPDARIEEIRVAINDPDVAKLSISILFSLQRDEEGERFEASVTVDGIVTEGVV